jgi:hypothetical protein
VSAPLTPEERASFRAYAEANRTEADGTESQWASYTLRLLDEVERRRPKAPPRFTPIRCRLSREGREALRRDGSRGGLVIGESRDRVCWRVIFDGRAPSSAETYHKDFIELEPEAE